MILDSEQVLEILAHRTMRQKDLAIKIGVSESAISRYLKNPDKVRPKTVGAIADALDVPTEILIKEL